MPNSRCRDLLEAEGVIFIDANGEEIGPRLRKGVALDAKAGPRHIGGASKEEKP